MEARHLRWEVIRAEQLGSQTLYRLRGISGAMKAREIDLLHPFEPIQPILRDLQPRRAAQLRHWLVYHQAFLLEQSLGTDALLAVQPGRLRIEPYQLVPALRAIRMRRVRLLLADGVGLGKTIQAGLVLTELIARKLAHRILIVCPAGPLLEQWKLEMRERFGLRLEPIDRTCLEEIRRKTELGANPFDHISLGIASVDFLKQEKILEMVERTAYDVIVIDEAHHCADSGATPDREDSQRRRLAEVLARKCDALLLLTATPHDGNDRSFASLCELLDPSLVDGKGALRGEKYRPHVVRRLKSHVPGFRERIVLPQPVMVDDDNHPVRNLHLGLLEFIAPELKRAFRTRNYSNVLAFIALLKRSVSTVAAFRSTLIAVAGRFQQLLTEGSEAQEGKRQRLRTLRDYQKRLERFGTLSLAEEEELARLETEDLAHQFTALQREIQASSGTLRRVSTVVETLDTLVQLAAEAEPYDPKLAKLEEEIAEIRSAEPDASILIYTEYVDSQRAVVNYLTRAHSGEILMMSGEDPEAKRIETTERFRTQTRCILVSTDAAAEGLNLHSCCHHLIHLELPFNPNRLEQRNGRIDRYGQMFDPVVRYLYLRGTFEERILYRLIAKYERQRSRLTFVPNTLGLTISSDVSQERLLKGLINETERLFQTSGLPLELETASEDPGDDDAVRELLEEIDHTLRGFDQISKIHAWMGAAGINAESRLIHETKAAREAGNRAGQVDLAQFVCQAVLLDGGDLRGQSTDPVFTLRLPLAWKYGLDDLPGYDFDPPTIRLTTDPELITDAENRPVGYVGRAHPLVRRALDRVRYMSFGSMGNAALDVRVSAASSELDQPALLFTYVGRVTSRLGREVECVLAVLVKQDGTFEFFDSSLAWQRLAHPDRAINTVGVFEARFANWFAKADSAAQASAQSNFSKMAQEALIRRHEEIARDRVYHHDWVSQRVTDLISQTQLPDTLPDLQPSLFDAPTPATQKTRPIWLEAVDPATCLAALATDRSLSARVRNEAESVLRIFRQRMDILDASAEVAPPEVIKLGLLMLVPE